MKKRYLLLSALNLIFGVLAICLYLPFLLEAFNMAGFEWFEFVPKILKDNYYDALVCFGIFLLGWIIGVNVLSLVNKPNTPKFLFKLTSAIALILPLIFVLALKNENVFTFWLKHISKDIKTISLIFLTISWGSFVLALILNFVKSNHANLHHILQAFTMCLLLTLIIVVFGWCGWNVSHTTRLYGIMVGLFAIYLPISSLVLFLCRNKRT